MKNTIQYKPLKHSRLCGKLRPTIFSDLDSGIISEIFAPNFIKAKNLTNRHKTTNDQTLLKENVILTHQRKRSHAEKLNYTTKEESRNTSSVIYYVRFYF